MMLFANGNRIEWIDAVKGIGILCVMYHHHPDYLGEYAYFVTAVELCLFFIIPGFLYEKPAPIVKLAKQLLFPYFVYGIIVTAVDYFYVYPHLGMQCSPLNWIGLLFGRQCYILGGPELMTANAGPMWFLPCLFITKIIFQKVVQRLSECISIAVFFIVGLILVEGLLRILPVYLPLCIDLVPLSLAFMLMGKILKLMNFEWNRLSIYCFFIIYLLITYINGNCNYYMRNFGSLGHFSIIVFFIQGFLFFCFLSQIIQKSAQSKLTQCLTLFGKNSLRLLCLHGLIINSLIPFLFRSMGLDFFCKLPILIPCLLCVIYIFDAFIARYRKKISLLKFL